MYYSEMPIAQYYTNRICYKNKYEKLLKKYQREIVKSHIFETLYNSTRAELDLCISKGSRAVKNDIIEKLKE